ncbi:hypothetical protein DSL72_001641 [Monilinia vaccinii-corymbosi]|uniref:Uncharacterized protein n=1 Tax=Monilinia vaccinii-corymbosi TaxID=61207 RepID=A0A8A3P4B0_9HELO|nr:hypothetical protein DSL72_001641 [Monilinia vaccinii-corymbosi]
MSNVTVLCDEYDCRKLVRPWLGNWLSELWDYTNLHLVEWLWISYCFGIRDVFQELVRVSAIKAIPGDEGDYLIPYSFDDPNLVAQRKGPWSTRIDWRRKATHRHLRSPSLETLLNIRASIISRLLSEITNFIDLLADAENSSNCNETCNSAMVGLFITKLRSSSLWPIPKVEDISLPAFELSRKIEALFEKAHKAYITVMRSHPHTRPCRLRSAWSKARVFKIGDIDFCDSPSAGVVDIDFLKPYQANMDRGVEEVGDIKVIDDDDDDDSDSD